MSNKVKFEYTEKNHILEVDGVDYIIPQRTPEIIEKISEHDAKIKQVSEYESNMNLLDILFGVGAAEKMFPDKQNTNLDKLARCVKFAVSLFLSEYNKAQTEDINSQLKDLDPVIKAMDKIERVANIAETKNFISQNKK